MPTPPLIAIDGELLVEPVPAVRLPNRYADAIQLSGGLPLALPALGDEGFVEDVLDRVDGLLLSGGDDFDTAALGLGPTHTAAKPVPAAKQTFDLHLVKRAIEREIPVLGVCYGMQLLALAEGGDLHQHLPEDRPGSREHAGGVRHEVQLAQGSKLAGLLGVSQLTVVSRHHQALSKTGPDWIVSAVDDEGLIEAIEREAHPFALGVQWHPELDVERPNPELGAERTNTRAQDAVAATSSLAQQLFTAFVDAAAAHRVARSLTPKLQTS